MHPEDLLIYFFLFNERKWNVIAVSSGVHLMRKLCHVTKFVQSFLWILLNTMPAAIDFLCSLSPADATFHLFATLNRWKLNQETVTHLTGAFSTFASFTWAELCYIRKHSASRTCETILPILMNSLQKQLVAGNKCFILARLYLRGLSAESSIVHIA